MPVVAQDLPQALAQFARNLKRRLIVPRIIHCPAILRVAGNFNNFRVAAAAPVALAPRAGVDLRLGLFPIVCRLLIARASRGPRHGPTLEGGDEVGAVAVGSLAPTVMARAKALPFDKILDGASRPALVQDGRHLIHRLVRSGVAEVVCNARRGRKVLQVLFGKRRGACLGV